MGRKNKKQRSPSCNVDASADHDDDHQNKASLPFLQLMITINISINPFSKLQIVLTPENDVPHPRHLCFLYPFACTSHKRRYCIKCICCLCGTNVSFCKKWGTRRPLRHCDATIDCDQLWMERTRRPEYLNEPNPPPARYKLFISLMRRSPENDVLEGFSGGIIKDEKGKWVAGFSMKFCYNDPKAHIHILTAIHEGLKLAFSKAELIKFLDIHLGIIAFEPNFISNYFKPIDNDGKPSFTLLTRDLLPWSDSPDYNDDLYSLLESIEEYVLNHQVVVDIKEAKAVKELSTAPYALINHHAYRHHLVLETQVYDFSSDDTLTDKLQRMAGFIKGIIPSDEAEALDFVSSFTRLATGDPNVVGFRFGSLPRRALWWP